MPDKPLEQACDARVCIHTDQILDSCMDKDCVEDLRVYLTRESQAALDRSTGAKTRCAELLFARVEVEPLAYKRGHYAVDLTFYYRILGDATVGGTRPVTITGLAVFTKRVALYGGRGKAKTFSSTDALPTPDGLLQDRLPVGVVEALDPMILASKVREVCDCCRCETELTEIPPAIAEALGEELVLTGGTRRLYVTVGQFSTVRLERGAQLAVQSGGYCMPTRECCDDEGCEEDPCELFSRVDFPVRAFYPEAIAAEQPAAAAAESKRGETSSGANAPLLWPSKRNRVPELSLRGPEGAVAISQYHIG